jgi:hypothetical protein
MESKKVLLSRHQPEPWVSALTVPIPAWYHTERTYIVVDVYAVVVPSPENWIPGVH